MKKFFAIPVAGLFLLSVMHLTIATHLCGGSIAAVRVSFTGTEATCGMESDNGTPLSTETRIFTDCCDNEIAVYEVGNDYTPSHFQLNELSQHMIHPEILIPEYISFYSPFSSLTYITNAGPPGQFSANEVCIADICVFRI